jgi:hypothetical protein
MPSHNCELTDDGFSSTERRKESVASDFCLRLYWATPSAYRLL